MEVMKKETSVFKMSIDKEETTFSSVDEIVNFLKENILKDKVATFIGVFDHYKHTSELEVGEIAADVVDAKNILFCFGKTLPNGDVLALRPRSIGITELKDRFMITFMEAQTAFATETMIQWVEAVRNKSSFSFAKRV